MCFHSKQSQQAQKVEKRFKAKVKDKTAFSPSEHYNAFTFPQTPIITNEAPELIQHYNWGLIPHWASDQNIRQYTLNAKIETLTEKPSFRKVTQNRCLVIADGFYEWQWQDSKGKNKVKHLVTLPDNSLYAYGGLWSEWLDQSTGELVHSYTIVTTAANELMSKVHNSKKRMPIILSPENEYDWLNGKNFEEFRMESIELIATPEENNMLQLF